MSRSPHLSGRTLAAAVLSILAAGAPILTPAAEAAYESDYASRVTVTFGENVHTSLPMTVELPAPASGSAVRSVTMSWDEVVPQVPLGTQYTTTTVRKTLDISGCTADSSCTVRAVLPTARMENGRPAVWFSVRDADGLVSLFSRTFALQNPKPTVSFLSPQRDEALWGEVTLSARAAVSSQSGAAPLKGVRFYLTDQLGPEAPYVFDTTAPYSVTLPATDIAPVLGSRYLVVVAEDADGNLSQMPDPSSSVRRPVTVGPPPEARWTSPRVGGRIAGSARNGVSLEFDAGLPETVPSRPGNPSDPHITGYDVTLDGVALGSSDWTRATSWNNYTANTKLRAIRGWWPIDPGPALGPGWHSVAVRVRTSYGAVTTLTSRLLVADGVTWGQVRSRGRVVRDGHWVTAGTLHRFAVPVKTRVAGTRLVSVGALGSGPVTGAGGQDLLPAGWPCAMHAVATCPSSTTMHTTEWAVSNRPGTQVLTFTAGAEGDQTDTLTRTIRVQPAARLSFTMSTRSARPGQVVRFSGRLARRDTGRAEPGRSVHLQWTRPDRLRWVTVATKVTRADGWVHFRHRPTRSGHYRLHSAQVSGQIGPGSSAERTLSLRR